MAPGRLLSWRHSTPDPRMSELQDLSSLVRSNTPLIVIETPD